MTTFRRFLSISSASFLAASLSLASELSWDFAFSPSDVTLSPAGAYTVVSLADGSNVRDAIGAPAIPAKFANILLPDGATDVSLSATGDLVLLASDVTPYPVQRVAPKSKPQPPFTAPDPAAYASASPWPAAVATYEGVHEMQGSTFVSVRVNPLVYVASEKALYYRPAVTVTVTYTAPATPATRARSVSQNALATEMVNALVVNPEAADAPSAVRRRAAARAATVDYLIITSSTLSNAFQNLAAYRATSAGGSFKTLVVTTNTIASDYAGDDIQMKIRNCISNYVKTAGTTYVVLGGDDSVVPDRDCYAYVPDNSDPTYEWCMPTDLYYSDLTGTWKANNNTNFGVTAANVDMSPDVIVGRIPVRNASQLNGYLAKVQAFEADTSHTRNSIILGGPAAWCRYYGSKRPSDNVSLDGHAAFRSTSPAHTYVSDSEMWLRRLYRDGIYTNWNRTESASSRTVNIACDSITSWDSSKCGDKELSASNLQTWLNKGYTHLMFSGHGYPQGWGMEGSANYSTSQASAQTNLVAFVYTDACLTGAFDEDGIASSGITVDVGTSDQYKYTSEPCLGEAYIRNSSGGALVHMGCARYGWGTPDYQNSDPDDEDSDGYYTNCTASASSDGGPSTVYAYKFYKRLYESAAVSSNRTLGAAFAMSKADMISQCSSYDTYRWIQFGLNYLGDPAIALYPRAVPDAAPEFDSATASIACVTGETVSFDFSSLLVAGSPAPTYYLFTSASYDSFSPSTGVLSFTPSAAGTYTFTCSASNSEGSDDCTLTVTVTPAPPATPSEVTTDSSDSFTATWSPVTGATAYELLVVEGAAAGSGTVVTETFANVTFTTKTSSYANQTISDGDLGTWTATQCRGDQVKPLFKASGTLTSPSISNGVTSVEFDYDWPFSGDNGNTCDIDLNVNGENKGSASVTGGTSGTASYTSFDAVSGPATIEFLNKATSNMRIRVTEVRIGTAGSRAKALPRAADDVVYSNSVGNVTNFTVTGLQPETTYTYTVRAIVNGQPTDWSDSVSVTTTEGEAAPAWSAIPAQTYRYGSGDGYFDFDVSSYASGSPAPAFYLGDTALSAALLTTGEFTFEPAALGTFSFTVIASNSIDTASTTLSVTVDAIAPELAAIGDRSGTLGSDVTFTVSATGDPAPAYSVTSTDAPAGSFSVNENTGAFTFTPAATGTFSFTFTASNIAGSDSETVTVTVSPAPVTVPTLTVSDVDSTSATASWTACDGATSYTLQLASDDQFTSASSGGGESVELVNEGFDNGTTLPTGWTVESGSIGGTYEANSTGNYGVSAPSLKLSSTVTISTPTLSNPTNLSFWYKGNGNSLTSTLVVEQLVGGTWSEVDTPVITGTATTPSYPLNSSATQVHFIFTKASGNLAFDDVLITGTSGSSGASTGSLISSETVSGLTSTFTGLTPETTYYARVKGDDDWSNVEEFTTESAGDSAPVWSALPTPSVTVGSAYSFTPSEYVSGTPVPTITLSSTTASSGYTFADGTLSFTPAATGSFTFTFLAENSLGSASSTLTVTATGTAPSVSVPQSSCSTTLGGADVEFTVTATGTPTPTLALSDTTATSGYAFDENDGFFTFTPYATGSFTFTFTATSLLGSDSETVTVSVSPAPVTVPTLSVTDVTTTTALASWTACDGVSSYTLQLTTNDFPAAASTSARSLTPILSEDFSDFTANGTTDISGSLNNYTQTSGWDGYKVYCNSGEAKIGASSGQAWLMTPALTVSGSLTVVWEARTYGSSDKYTLLLGISEDGNDFTDTTITLYDDMTGYTNTFEVTGTTAYVRWMGSGSSKARFYLDNVSITTPTSGGGDDPAGDDVQEFTVTGTSYTFTDLTPDTAYLARVKGNAGWSEEVVFQTLGTSDTAPAIDPIADQTYTYGDNEGEFTLAVTASGTPSPTLSVTSDDAIGLFDIDAAGEFIFMPTAVGTFHFTVTAANGVSPNATASFAVTVTGTAPTLAAIADQTVAVEEGELTVPLTVAGNPAPTVTVASADAPEGLFEINADGNFYFVFAEAGTFHFTVTATNGVSPDATQSFAVTVTAAPAPLTDYQQWLQDHGVATDTSADAAAPNGHTYGECYAADIDPSSAQWLEVTVTTTNFTIAPSSANRWYQLLYTTDLTLPLESYTATNLGKGATSGSFPVDGDWFGGLRVSPIAPANP